MSNLITWIALGLQLLAGPAIPHRQAATHAAPAPAPARATFPTPALELTPPAPPPPAMPSNRLRLESGGLDLSVGAYTDCTHQSEVGHDGGYIDECLHQVGWYFIGHNPGPFTALTGVPTGAVVDYYDPQAREHRFQIISDRTWNRYWGAPPPIQPGVAAQFQTCLTLDGTWDHIYDAVELPNPAVPAPAKVEVRLGEYRTT
jgi:hypothetical protein